MEGSRHERAVLVGLAYFIGGLTAFIWYSHGLIPQLEIPLINDQPANVISAVEPKSEQTDSKKSIVNYLDGKLEVNAFGNEKVLSFNSDLTGQSPSADFSEQGTHVGELAFSASPSEEYVFFCEKKSVLAGTCSPFVYDVVADTIYPVRLNDKRVEILTTAASSALWSENYLQIDTEASKDPSKPWLLGGY